jgi:hypothetical protein
VAFFAIGTSGVLLISLMKKLRVTLKKRTGNVVEFLKTMRRSVSGRSHVPEAKAAVPQVTRL